MVTDAASYDRDGYVLGIGTKTFPVPHWPGVIAARGPAIPSTVLADRLSFLFGSFDEFVEGAERTLPDLVDTYYPDLPPTQFMIAGWSEARQAPESYILQTADEPEGGLSDDGVENGLAFEEYQLVRLPDCIYGPAITMDARVAGFSDPNLEDDPAKVVAALQRAIQCQRETACDGQYIVGGFAGLTTVWPDRIEQRVLMRWPEDEIGEKIAPAKPVAKLVAIPEGLSRVKREMLERKVKKGRLVG